MQKLIIEEPYHFIPPYRGRRWSSAFRIFLPSYLRLAHGIVAVECRGLDRLRESVAAGRGVLLTPNHSRLSDPMTLGWVVRETGIHFFTMASWHLFKQENLADRAGGWMMRRLGAFSILREGTDRAALNCAIDILASAQRPLVIFPEGVISRANDRLGTLMDGTGFVARAAAKRAAKAGRPGVVVHPVTLRYVFLDDVAAAVAPTLTEFERRLTWEPRPELSPTQRALDLQRALLSLKELEFTGRTSGGDPHERRRGLIEHLLQPIETEWLGRPGEGTAVTRVKDVRAATLPTLLDPATPPAVRDRVRRQLAAAYLAQQLHFYPDEYLTLAAPPERLLETVERLDEDVNGTIRLHGRMRVIIDIGEAIEVPAERERSAGRGPDPLLGEIAARLRDMLAATAAEVAAGRERRSSDTPASHRPVAAAIG